MNDGADESHAPTLGDRLKAGFRAYQASRRDSARLRQEIADERQAVTGAHQRATSQTLVKTYRGRQRSVRRQFERESAVLAGSGYTIVSQSVVGGHHRSFFSFRSTPKDQLIVTYRRDDQALTPAPNSDAVITQLERLVALRSSGALSESEFVTAKRRLLANDAQ